MVYEVVLVEQGRREPGEVEMARVRVFKRYLRGNGIDGDPGAKIQVVPGPITQYIGTGYCEFCSAAGN